MFSLHWRAKGPSTFCVRQPLGDRGSVLALSLILLVILTLFGMGALAVSSIEMQNAAKYKSDRQAFYAAEAGTEEVRGRLRGIAASNANLIVDPAASPNPNWTAYVITSNTWASAGDPNYDASATNYFPTTGPNLTNTTVTANSLQPGVPYDWVKVRHKREYDAEQEGHTTGNPKYVDGDGSTATHTAASPGNIIYYGYQTASSTVAVAFTVPPLPNPQPAAVRAQPIEIITARSRVQGASKGMQIVVRHGLLPPITSPFYGDIVSTAGGAQLKVNGNDQCGVLGSLPPITYFTSYSDSGHPDLNGGTATQLSSQISVVSLVNSLKNQATMTLTEDKSSASEPDIGSATNYITVYADATTLSPDAELDLANFTGYGVLVVNGDLHIHGGTTWRGLILVSGNMTLGGGGGDTNVYGAAMSHSASSASGSIDLKYNSCEAEKATKSGTLTVISWAERSF